MTAIQEGGQRLPAGPRPPLTSIAAAGTTRTRPLMATVPDEGPKHKAIGAATTLTQTTDALEPTFALLRV